MTIFANKVRLKVSCFKALNITNIVFSNNNYNSLDNCNNGFTKIFYCIKIENTNKFNRTRSMILSRQTRK
jgi:hypothetical protein